MIPVAVFPSHFLSKIRIQENGEEKEKGRKLEKAFKYQPYRSNMNGSALILITFLIYLALQSSSFHEE